MEDNNNNTPEKTKKPKKESVLSSLSKIKLKSPIPKGANDLPIPMEIYLCSQGGGFTRSTVKKKYSLNILSDDPIGMIKKEPRLARYTTATEEQVKFITNNKLEKLRSA